VAFLVEIIEEVTSGGEGRIRTYDTACAALRSCDRRFQPLSHLSASTVRQRVARANVRRDLFPCAAEDHPPCDFYQPAAYRICDSRPLPNGNTIPIRLVRNPPMRTVAPHPASVTQRRRFAQRSGAPRRCNPRNPGPANLAVNCRPSQTELSGCGGRRQTGRHQPERRRDLVTRQRRPSAALAS
jgi:hypothetical protein